MIREKVKAAERYDMANKIICKYCGAEINEMDAKCPYCGSTNYIGAESEYFDKLEDVREDLEELEEVPQEEIRKEFRKQGKFLKIVFLVIGIIAVICVGYVFLTDLYYERAYGRDDKKDFLWRQENYPVMDALYEQGEYEELYDFYRQAVRENAPVWDWEHVDYCCVRGDAEQLQYWFDKEASGEPLSEEDYTSLLQYELSLVGIMELDLDEKERELVKVYQMQAQEDFEQRWDMTEEEKAFFYERLEENHGWVEQEYCEDYVEKWYKEQQK